MFEVQGAEPDVQAHHLIPKNWSKVSDLRADLRERVIDGLANLTPLSDATSGTISNDAAAKYVAKFAASDPDESDEGIDAMLRQHLIHPELLRAIDDVPDLDGHVERFLEERLDAIVKEFMALVDGDRREPSVS